MALWGWWRRAYIEKKGRGLQKEEIARNFHAKHKKRFLLAL